LGGFFRPQSASLHTNKHNAHTIASEKFNVGIRELFALDSGMGVLYIRCMNYTNTLVVKLPLTLSDALAIAAEKAMMTKSEYVRQAIIEKLKQGK
jgi:uncharacterized membrane protein YwaF